ncbi:MAG TPA: hypothetical protein VNF68_05555 [Candidatus Baltobacteraceae bacterium]|nr:hypothetical protein [Candidatus Baltobacteraceae bacterium]
MDSKSGSLARGFALNAIDEVTYECSEELAGMYKLSPFVWRDRGGFELLLRVVNYSDDASTKVARIHSGFSSDGLHFDLEPIAVIAPGPDIPGATDSGGCEDPTVAIVEGRYYVYYSGWNEHIKRGELLLASGPTLQHLEKRGIALASSKTLRNPKEATIVRVADGTWRLFFEFAEDDRSKIGLASSPNVDGPWTVLDPLFAARAGRWDDWHLSTGPIFGESNLPVMFYNGATRDAHWRIGWVVFDPLYCRVLARSEEPVIDPGPRRYPEDTDLAFAASAVEEDSTVRLYYSIADRHVMRATLRRA